MDVLLFLSRTSTEKERIKEDRDFASLKPIEGDGTERRKDYVLRKRKYGYRLRIRQVTYVYKLTRIQYCGKEVSRGLSRGRKKTRTFIDPAQIDRIIRNSKLYREKWDSPRGDTTYGMMTVMEALRGKTRMAYEPER